ncbi:unnamed protein product [Urochloa decumbens]|uniref:Thiol methyltransferase 1 n=1 Tax=Urochloa decumbens TaxID=240449 RepID=A0ABC8Y5B0_9POAL
MASTAVAGQVLDGSNPAVARVRQLVGGRQEYSPDGWSRCWEEGVTPWDLGQPTPAVVELVKSGTLPGDGATVLVPGCGAGYDVVALSGPGRFVVGLDICETAVAKAKQWSAAAAGGDESLFAFVAADFFTWEPPERFDLIFDYTYEEVLKPLGFVITCIQDNHVAVKPRQGMEKIAKWKRMANPTDPDSAQ